MLTENSLKIRIISLILFGIMVPLSLSINFFQNDDWVYYKNVESFLRGDFTIDPYTGPTFYVQGLLGAGVAALSSIEHLPVLTLAFGVLNFFILTHILVRFFKRSVHCSVLISLIYFFNPINLYLLWGFMSGNYFLFFFLASLYLFFLYEESRDYKLLVGIFALTFAGLLVRQVALVIPISMAAYYLYKKEYKLFAINLSWFGILFFYLNNIFPVTRAMKRASLQYQHFLDTDYTYTLIYSILLMLTAYLLPLVLYYCWNKFLNSRKAVRVGVLVMTAVLFFVLNDSFEPEKISWGEFPYFENTVERTGFYPRGLDGTKYQFRGNFDLYKYWDLSSKIVLALFLATLVVNLRSYKSYVNIFSFSAGVYILVMVMTETFYDRYLLLLIPTAILFLSKEMPERRWFKIALAAFLTFLVVLGYQFSMDFILSNRYVWATSIEVAGARLEDRKYVQGTNAWKLNYRNQERNYRFNFSYDSPEVNEGYECCYTLREVIEVKFPFSLFIEPNIYVYKLNEPTVDN